MTQQQLILIRRMVWKAERNATRKATIQENDSFKPDAIATMVYAAVLNGFVYDLFDAVRVEIPNPQKELRVIARLRKATSFAHDKIYKVFDSNIPFFGSYYNGEYDKATETINKAVMMDGVERYYNIVLALLRITKHYNERCGRWRSPAICDLYQAERRLKELNLPINDNSEVVEMIIKKAVNIKIPD